MHPYLFSAHIHQSRPTGGVAAGEAGGALGSKFLGPRCPGPLLAERSWLGEVPGDSAVLQPRAHPLHRPVGPCWAVGQGPWGFPRPSPVRVAEPHPGEVPMPRAAEEGRVGPRTTAPPPTPCALVSSGPDGA